MTLKKVRRKILHLVMASLVVLLLLNTPMVAPVFAGECTVTGSCG